MFLFLTQNFNSYFPFYFYGWLIKKETNMHKISATFYDLWNVCV